MNIVLIISLLITVLVGCSDNSLLKEQLVDSEIDEVHIVTAMGNPEYGADSKTITSPKEIELLIETFNSAKVGNKVQEDEIGIGETSSYSFLSDDKLISKFEFNVNNSKIIWHNGNYHYVEYDKDLKTPFEIYKNSKAEVVVVDIDGKEMERPSN